MKLYHQGAAKALHENSPFTILDNYSVADRSIFKQRNQSQYFAGKKNEREGKIGSLYKLNAE